MIGSDEVDPSHAQQIIMNKEVVSLTFWLQHVIFIPNSALITSCFSHYLLSVLKSKRVWQPLEIPISSITAHLRVTEGCENWLERGKGEGGREEESTWGVTQSEVGSRDKRAFMWGWGYGERALTWKVQHNSPVWREELLSLNEESLFGLAALLSGSGASQCQKARGLGIKQAQSHQSN